MTMRTFHLQPLTTHDEPIEFTWDDQAGEFTGPDAVEVSRWVDLAAGDGSVVSDPYPTSYPAAKARTEIAHLAAALSLRWALDDELRDALPVVQGDTPESALN